MTYVLGVDGGGSKTLAVIADENGRVMGVGRAGGSNHQVAGVSAAVENIRQAMEQARTMAGIEWNQVQHTVYGLAGADRAKDIQLLGPALTQLPPASWQVYCDTMIGLRLGSPEMVGVVLICGSGTNAAGRNRRGETVQTGGMGYLFGDGAGGTELARSTFRAAIRSWEYREPPSILVDLVPQRLGFRNIQEVLDYYYDHDATTVPLELALVAHEAANRGDELASSLLRQTGRELGLAAHSVATRLGGLEPSFPLVLIGGVLQNGRNPLILSSLAQVLTEQGWTFRMVIPDVPPVWGAVLMAMDHVGIRLTESDETVLRQASELITRLQ